MWEKHCEKLVHDRGFVPIGNNFEWRSCFYHTTLKVVLVVYVDDFKMAGPIAGVAEAWKRLRTIEPTIKMSDPAPVSHYLGCKHTVEEKVTDGKKAKVMTYDMESFLKTSCDMYLSLAGSGTTLDKVSTPFIDEDDRENQTRQPASIGPGLVCPWCEFPGNKDEFLPYDPNKKKPKKLDTSSPTQIVHGEKQMSETGRLQPIAAKVIMKVFYAARLARFDLLRAIGHLAGYITKWTPDCDRRLHQLMSYIHSTLDHRMCGWVGDEINKVDIHLYCDADFAGCQNTNKSTSGVCLKLEGPNTSFPISASSKKQTCVSNSTPEAEIVAGSFGLRLIGIPGLVMWETIRGEGSTEPKSNIPCYACGNEHLNQTIPNQANIAAPAMSKATKKTLRKKAAKDAWMNSTEKPDNVNQDEKQTSLIMHDDNEAMIQVCRTGRNPTMRHLGRTHGISISYLHQEQKTNYVKLGYINTDKMAADIFTKFYP
jgi:hypothetical protein